MSTTDVAVETKVSAPAARPGSRPGSRRPYIVSPLYDWSFFIASPLLALGLGLLAAAPLAAPGLIGGWLHDGQAEGLTLDSLLTGRPEIWRRSLHAVADFTWTGVGVGSFREVVPALYYPAGSGDLEHAHSLVLQTALDLGVGGLLAMAAIVWLALRRAGRAWCSAPGPGAPRARAAALFASLLAFCLFNLFDAVALGRPGGVAFFLLLGLIYALPRPRRRRRRRIPAHSRRRLLLAAILMLLGLSSIRGTLPLNRAAVLGARAVAGEPGLLPAAHAALAAGAPAGRLARRQGRPGLGPPVPARRRLGPGAALLRRLRAAGRGPAAAAPTAR